MILINISIMIVIVITITIITLIMIIIMITILMKIVIMILIMIMITIVIDLFIAISFNRKGLVAHSYADDTQVHLSVAAYESPVAAWQFSECIMEIDGWMRSNRLKMNTHKTQLIWIGASSCQGSTSMRPNCSWTRYHSPHLCQTWA